MPRARDHQESGRKELTPHRSYPGHTACKGVLLDGLVIDPHAVAEHVGDNVVFKFSRWLMSTDLSSDADRRLYAAEPSCLRSRTVF